MNFIKTISCTSILLLLNTPVIAKTVFSPYADITLNAIWSPEYQEMIPISLDTIAANNQIKSYHLAFITDSGSCQAGWGGQSAYSLANKWGQHLTDALAKQGTEIIISFGGASGNDLSLQCDPNALLTVLNQTVSTYHAKGLDFDVENGTANVTTLITALQLFQKQNPSISLSFTLPVMPEGLTYDGKQLIEQAKQANLNFKVNIMTMDYGSSYTDDMGGYAVQAATALHDYLQSIYPNKSASELWQKVEVTPMIGVNDVHPEQFTLENAKTLNKFAIDHQIGGLSMWSIARDVPCVNKWADATCSGNNLQKSAYEFVKTLNL